MSVPRGKSGVPLPEVAACWRHPQPWVDETRAICLLDE